MGADSRAGLVALRTDVGAAVAARAASGRACCRPRPMGRASAKPTGGFCTRPSGRSLGSSRASCETSSTRLTWPSGSPSWPRPTSSERRGPTPSCARPPVTERFKFWLVVKAREPGAEFEAAQGWLYLALAALREL